MGNRPFAAKPSRDLLFIKLWAATLRMPETGKACRKHQNGQVWSPRGIKKWDFMTVWILKKFRRFVWNKQLYFHTNLIFFEIQTTIKSHPLMLGTSNFAILVFLIYSFHFWHSLSYSQGRGRRLLNFVYRSSNEKWRHIRFKLRRAARFTKRKNGVSICQDFLLFATHQVRFLSNRG